MLTSLYLLGSGFSLNLFCVLEVILTFLNLMKISKMLCIIAEAKEKGIWKYAIAVLNNFISNIHMGSSI